MSGILTHPLSRHRGRRIFWRSGVRAFSILLLVIEISSITFAAPLPRSTPEEQGVSSAAVISCIEALDKIDSMNSFMLLRHGHVVAEGWWAPYAAESPHALYSLSKS